MDAYLVQTPLSHNGRRYVSGDRIALANEPKTWALLLLGAIVRADPTTETKPSGKGKAAK